VSGARLAEAANLCHCKTGVEMLLCLLLSLPLPVFSLEFVGESILDSAFSSLPREYASDSMVAALKKPRGAGDFDDSAPPAG
jgi:hypothetical protein